MKKKTKVREREKERERHEVEGRMMGWKKKAGAGGAEVMSEWVKEGIQKGWTT